MGLVSTGVKKVDISINKRLILIIVVARGVAKSGGMGVAGEVKRERVRGHVNLG